VRPAENGSPGERVRIAFEIPSTPRAKGRPRFTTRNGFARAYTPTETVRAEHDVAVLAAAHAPETPHDGAVVIDLTFVLPIPASWPRKRQAAALAGAVQPTSKPDRDNLEKLILDALTRSGQWWRDDSQIVDGRTRKVYGLVPCTRVVVELLKGAPQREGAGELFDRGVA
jgi:Holliday junction resolvase RusA-like endonuclease